MRRETLEAFVFQVIAAQSEAKEIYFSWQGGEPTLAGIDFFRDAVELQERYRPPGAHILNALQTNGTLIDAGWATFLAEHGFLVGVSIDGPARMHDPLRRYPRGTGSHAHAVRAIEWLARASVEFNTLTVVHRLNYLHGREVYRFLRRLGSRYMQFIPLVERQLPDGTFASPSPSPENAAAQLAPWTAPREAFGRFLCEVFDDWFERDVGTVSVQLIEERIAALAGLPAQLCVFAPDCSATPMLEADGDVFGCDHYAYPPFRLGNIAETPIGELVTGDSQRAFGRLKRDPLPQSCFDCQFLLSCFGGCPKHRFVPVAFGEAENYLCPSYRQFFAHTAVHLARLVRTTYAGTGDPRS